jgi:UDP-N-acetylglucosamine 2-epimerase
MREFSLSFKSKNIKVIEPVGYSEMICLVKNARFCMTDSGGLQEEAAVLKTPTLVIRHETEYQHYVQAGILFLTGPSKNKIVQKVNALLEDAGEYARIKSLNIPYVKDSSSIIVNKMMEFLG